MMTIASAKARPAASLYAACMTDGVKVYGQGATTVRALDGVTVTFPRGQFTAIMGPSGSGKSTLLHCLAGLDTLTSGSVVIGDVRLDQLDDTKLTLLRRERVGFVFQTFNLLPTLSARENVLLPLTLARRKPDSEWFDALVESLRIGDRLSHRPSELSGGQQQRVAMARALINRPTLLFADEPTGDLDSTSAGELLSLIRKAVDDLGQSVVMVTHDPRAASYADRALFLSDGQLVHELLDPSPAGVLDTIKSLGA